MTLRGPMMPVAAAATSLLLAFSAGAQSSLGRSPNTRAAWVSAPGLDFSSNSELVAARLGQNETQCWMMATLAERRAARVGGTVAYNTAARSIDGALTAALRYRFLTLLAEGRAFSDALESGEAGHAGADRRGQLPAHVRLGRPLRLPLPAHLQMQGVVIVEP